VKRIISKASKAHWYIELEVETKPFLKQFAGFCPVKISYAFREKYPFERHNCEVDFGSFITYETNMEISR